MRARRESFLRELLADLTVYLYTKETAMLAGRIDGEQQSQGVVIPFGDLLIGATALSLGFSVLTANLRHFLNPWSRGHATLAGRTTGSRLVRNRYHGGKQRAKFQ